MTRFTSVEQRIDDWAHRRLDTRPTNGLHSVLLEFLVFLLKQAWSCVFGAAILVVLVATKLWYPEGIALARNDFLVIAAVGIQVVMVAARLESLRELRVIVLFHLIGTCMELFKTSVGSWLYEGEGVLQIGGVPLYSGFMYAAIGSYMVRVYRLFDLRFDRYPRRWITALLAVLIYINFFSHHYVPDARYVLMAATGVIFGFCTMSFRIFRHRVKVPLLVTFVGVALFIWFAENIGTWAQAWQYPGQENGWQLVSLAKLGSWFLLMIISVVLVAWVYPPRPLDTGGSGTVDVEA
ncbi:MAG: DUF817 domain-containing protein [Rhodoglobus sp.]